MDHSACARALAHFAVLPQLYRNIANVGIRVHEWSDRCVGVERFAAAKLLLLFLQITISNIEAYGVTENVVKRIIHADALGAGTNHDRKLNFEIRLMLWKGDFDPPIVR